MMVSVSLGEYATLTQHSDGSVHHLPEHLKGSRMRVEVEVADSFQEAWRRGWI